MADTQTPLPQEAATLDRYGYNAIARHVALVFFTCAPLFIAAGTLDWFWAWVYSIITLLGWLGLSVVLARQNPELLNQRGKRAKAMAGTKTWDWLILSLYVVLLLAAPYVAGLDYRNGWTGEVSPVVNIIGNLILVASFALLTWSMAINRHFEGTVRIQEQRGHQVVSSGPYRYVRHPGYVAVILQFVALPLALGMWAAWLPSLAGVVLYIVRAALEDAVLQRELPGYREFAQETRWRLLPGVW